MTIAGPGQPRLRKARLPDDALLVVRGDDLDPATARRQAEAFRRRYATWGRFGLSAYYARGDEDVDDLAEGPLERFPVLALLRVADLRASGLDVVPTFRSPHVTIAFADLDAGLSAVARLVFDLRENPYYEADPNEEEGQR